MDITRNDRIRMERAHVAAWPALQTAAIEGWLWRASGGGSQRANSVSTVDFTGNDAEGAIDKAESRYRTLNAATRFQCFDETNPADLPDRLRHRGYQPTDATITMFKRPEPVPPDNDIESYPSAWPDWMNVYLGEITENRRTTNQLIIDRIPQPAYFFAARRNGRLISTALCVIAFGCAVIECVATGSDFRRQGASRSVMRQLESWAAGQGAEWIGLQVIATNTPAVTLYRQLGFQPGATNRFWVLPNTEKPRRSD